MNEWVNGDDAGELAHALQREGWIPARRWGWRNVVGDQPSKVMRSLRRVLAAPITRASAERHLRSVIQRADEYNTDDKH